MLKFQWDLERGTHESVTLDIKIRITACYREPAQHVAIFHPMVVRRDENVFRKSRKVFITTILYAG